MTFPVEFHVFGRAVPAHGVFELLAYAIGFQTYLLLRRRARRAGKSLLSDEPTVWIIVGCVFGALVGSKLLAWVESPVEYWAARNDPSRWLGGKTIVGGLLGGWIGVEIAKKRLGIRTSTGDAFVIPLAIGMAVGRVGCFLTGLPDKTYGVHTSLPWAVNFGDGPRHPTQLYEILVLLIVATVLWLRSRRPHPNGQLFRLFMLTYLSFRFIVEFIKPRYALPIVHLSAIQLASAIGAIICAIQLSRGRFGTPDESR